MVHIAIDVHAILAQPENGRGRALYLKQRHRAECLTDLVALVAPAAQAHKAVLGVEVEEDGLERLAAVEEGAELVVESDLRVRDHEDVGIVGQLLLHLRHNQADLDAVAAERLVAVPKEEEGLGSLITIRIRLWAQCTVQYLTVEIFGIYKKYILRTEGLRYRGTFYREI